MKVDVVEFWMDRIESMFIGIIDTRTKKNDDLTKLLPYVISPFLGVGKIIKKPLPLGVEWKGVLNYY